MGALQGELLGKVGAHAIAFFGQADGRRYHLREGHRPELRKRLGQPRDASRHAHGVGRLGRLAAHDVARRIQIHVPGG